MPASLKLIASVVGVTGAVGGVACATLWKTGVLNSTSFENPSSPNPVAVNIITGREQTAPDTQNQSVAITKEGNCKVVKPVDESIFDSLGIHDDEYTTVHCKNTDEEDDIWDNWTGLFPNDLFGLYMGLNVGESFDLETSTELMVDSESNHRTTFKSEKFDKSPVIGDWGSPMESLTGKEITMVTLSSESLKSDDKMYLLFDQEI